MKSSLIKWEKNSKRYLTFKGTSVVCDCYGGAGATLMGGSFQDLQIRPDKAYARKKATTLINKLGWKTVLFEYSLDCDQKTYDRKGDAVQWTGLIIDQTPVLVANKYCPIEEWSKLPNK